MENYLNNIEARLSRLWPIQEQPDVWFSRQSGSTLTAGTVLATTPVRQLIERGGKRWRPLIMCLTSKALGAGDDDALFFTPLVELLHNASLVVDDIEDAAELRRGQPAIHKIYGLDNSINSANLAYFDPTILIDELAQSNPNLALTIYKRYSLAMRCVHLGQALDINWHNAHSYWPSRQEYEEMCLLKTGALAGLAAEIGYLMAKDNLNEAINYGKIWAKIGLAFQIIDDVKNITEEGIEGKEFGDDIVEGKKSLPVILYATDTKEREQLARLFVQAKSSNRAESILAIKEASALLSGAAHQAKEYGLQLLNEGIEALRLLPNHEARHSLIAILKKWANL